MAPLLSLFLSSLVVANSVSNVSSASAFVPTTAAAASSTSHRSNRNHFQQSMLSNDITHIRGGGPKAMTASSVDPAAKAKKVRISAFDSMRFFLIANIVLGHFIKFANPSEFVFKAFSQHNVMVGAFFALSGYVTAYTTTENKQRLASPKLTDTPKQKWILQRIFGYMPLHWFVLLLFSPVFLYADLHYNGRLITVINALLSITLTQAWAPQHAEIWNAPTWFLSSLNFATAIMPFGLPAIAKMDKKQLRRTLVWVFLAYLLPKLGYAYDHNAWSIVEGIGNPKVHPNLAVFNTQRFGPLFNVAEVVLGAIACRLVMMDGADGNNDTPKTNALSTLIPLVGIVGLTLGRAAGIVPDVSDLLFRALVFLPLFLRFLMSAHRNTVSSVKDPLVRFLSSNWLVALGNLSFPIFIVHGPIGQIFYKKLIASKLFGQVLMGPTNFAAYLATTLVVAWLLQKGFLQNKAVSDWSQKMVDTLSSWM